MFRIAACIRRRNSGYVRFGSNCFILFLNLWWTILTRSPLWLLRWLEKTFNFLKENGNIQSLTYGTDDEPALENNFEKTYPIESELSFLSLPGHFYKKWLVYAWTKFNPGKKESIFWFCLAIFHYLNGITNFSILNKTLDLIIVAWKTSIYSFVKKTVFQLVLTMGHPQR